MHLAVANHEIEATPNGHGSVVEGTCSCGMWHAGPAAEFEECWMFHVNDDLRDQRMTAQGRVVWKTPPPGRSGSNNVKWAGIRRALRQQPQQWALVSDDVSPGMVSKAKAMLGEWHEVVGRNHRDKKCDVYARYVGPT